MGIIKNIFSIILVLTSLQYVSAQTDRHGNPIFNSDNLGKESFNGYDVGGLYYNIKDNISNKKSSVYFNDNPSLEDYIRFSVSLPSYVYIVSIDQVMQYGIMLSPTQKDGRLKYIVLNSSGKLVKEIQSEIKGEIAEARADELIKLKVDSESRITERDGVKYFVFNEVSYKIIPYSKVKTEALKIASELMYKEEIKNPIEYIKMESIDGKLDFKKILDANKLYILGDIAYSQPEAVIYMWAKAVKKAGISSEDEAIELWEEIYKQELTPGNKKALIAGFNSK